VETSGNNILIISIFVGCNTPLLTNRIVSKDATVQA
jgi:hypothetical protein